VGWIISYLLTEVTALLAVGLAGITFVLATVEVVDLVDLAFAKGVPVWRIVTIFAYTLPAYLDAG
jgi:lipopolysaccharide export LptBFGC system permease protein LptF